MLPEAALTVSATANQHQRQIDGLRGRAVVYNIARQVDRVATQDESTGVGVEREPAQYTAGRPSFVLFSLVVPLKKRLSSSTNGVTLTSFRTCSSLLSVPVPVQVAVLPTGTVV